MAKLSAGQRDALVKTLEARFRKHEARHPKVSWDSVSKKLTPAVLSALHEMEETGGEPDVVSLGGSLAFVDCSAETPSERRSLCYDGEALRSRKENKPKGSAVELAESMGIELLDEALYAELQQVGSFDAKTSSWLKTPAPFRKLGGALFGDFRFGRVFTYHNGAESYYAARGFRGLVRL